MCEGSDVVDGVMVNKRKEGMNGDSGGNRRLKRWDEWVKLSNRCQVKGGKERQRGGRIQGHSLNAESTNDAYGVLDLID
jgi:hypothetical protein